MDRDQFQFNLKFVNLITIIFLILISILSVTSDLLKLTESSEFSEISFIFLRDHYMGTWGTTSTLFTILVILCTISCVFTCSTLKNMLKRKEEKMTHMQQLGSEIMFLLSVSRILEIVYSVFDTDLVISREIVGNLYMIFDILSMIMFLFMGVYIFVISDSKGNFVQGKIFYRFLLIVYCFLYVVLILFSYSEAFYLAGIAIFALCLLVMIIIAVLVVIQIVKLRKTLTSEQLSARLKKLTGYIGISLLLFILSIVFLTIQAQTVLLVDEGIIFPNRLSAIGRVSCLLAISILSYMQFSKNKKK